MKKMIVTLMFVLWIAALVFILMACIEDGAPLEETPPDATPPTTEPDASPTTPDAPPPATDAGVDCPPDAPPPPPPCTCDDDCDDDRSWTGDACNPNGACVHWVTDCGGMQVRPATNAATCEFWAGFGTPEPAPSLGLFSASGLPTGPSGGNWKAAPPHACSVICYNAGLSEAVIDIQIEWNGLTFQHQQITGLKKGTWDGKNLGY